jgi:hypothetical protein
MLVENYSMRALTYENDNGRAFAGAAEIMSSTYPGGLLHGLPIFFFDIAILWHPKNSDLTRRPGQPSWSWTGWKEKAMSRRIEDRLEALWRRFGYAPYKMSRFEEYELYVRNKDFLESDRVSTFSGKDGRLLAMKPDVTLSIVKNAPEAPGAVRKVHYRENVYRQDRDSGDFKEILQSGLECVGDVGAYEVAEVVYLAAKSLEAIGPGTILSLSHVGLIRYALEKSGLPDHARKQALDCLRQKREQELRLLCTENGADETLPVALLQRAGYGVRRSCPGCPTVLHRSSPPGWPRRRVPRDVPPDHRRQAEDGEVALDDRVHHRVDQGANPLTQHRAVPCPVRERF